MLYPNFEELLDLKARASSRNIKSSRLTHSLASGGYFSPFRGQGLEFDEVRAYVPGDDVRKIDWRVTARSGVPHIKLFTEERERKVLICLDACDYMCFGTRGTFKSVQAARIAALIGWSALSSSNTLGSCIFGNSEAASMFFKPSRRQSSFLRFLEKICQADTYINTSKTDSKLKNDSRSDNHLSDLKQGRQQSSQQSNQKSNYQADHQAERPSIEIATKHIARITPPGTLVFIISDFLDMTDVLEKNLRDINEKSELVMISVNDPADIKIPDCGSMIFNPGTIASKWKKYFNSSAGTVPGISSKDKLPSSDLYESSIGEDMIIDTSNKKIQGDYNAVWMNASSRLESLKNEYAISHIQMMTNAEDVYSELFSGLAGLSKQRGRR